MLSLYFSLLLPRPAPANPSQSPFARDAFVRVEGVGAGRRSLVLAEQERVVHLLLTGRDLHLARAASCTVGTYRGTCTRMC